MDARRVLLVGLGTIARTHHEVLTAEPTVAIVGGVDPGPGALGAAELGDVPVVASLHEAFASGLEPDLVVLATPTETHVDLVSEVLGRSAATVLCEKPLAAGTAELDRLERTHGAEAVAGRVAVAHHFAFSPEVEWARGLVAGHPEWGEPTRIVSVFNDAYANLPQARRASLVSSWVDSGPNQLSVAAAFAADWTVRSHADEVERAVTVLTHAGGTTLLSSNWLAADTSKQTMVDFRGGEVQVRLDHTSMTAVVIEAGVITEHLAYGGTASRKVAHYLGLYRALLAEPGDWRLSVALARAVAEVLESAGPRSARDQVVWSGN